MHLTLENRDTGSGSIGMYYIRVVHEGALIFLRLFIQNHSEISNCFVGYSLDLHDDAAKVHSTAVPDESVNTDNMQDSFFKRYHQPSAKQYSNLNF